MLTVKSAALTVGAVVMAAIIGSAVHAAAPVNYLTFSGPVSLPGVTLVRIGNLEEAVAYFRKWLEEDPDNPTARHLLGACGGVVGKPTAGGESHFLRHCFEGCGSLDCSVRSCWRCGKMCTALRPR